MPGIWVEPEEISVPASLRHAIGGNPLVATTLTRRGITESETARAFIDPTLYTPASPSELPDLTKAVDRLEQAIYRQEIICVWGDFDVDGQTATTLLVSTLRDLGAKVTYHIPVREKESHGINIPILDDFLDQGINLLLTCDTGIAAHEPITHAQGRGVSVIVTDHHDLPPELPPAYAIINPKMLSSGHALSTLPGVGVAYKLSEELYGRFNRSKDCLKHLDLVALGIVADIAILYKDTRYLLQVGLECLRNTQRLGLTALIEAAEIDPSHLTEEHIGFILGPRLNALGRLSDANKAIDFFTTSDLQQARILASELEGLNAQRRLLTEQVFKAAQAQIDQDPALLENPALVLAHQAWPAGVIGIVAGRLVEYYNRPVVLISAPLSEPARGSARSVLGINITTALAQNKELLSGFGGHPMAAGFSIANENIPKFKHALSRTIQRMMEKKPLQAMLQIDAFVPLSDLSIDFVDDLERLAPFGLGNPALILASRDLSLSGYVAVGRNDEHLLLTVKDESGCEQRVIWWQGAGWPLPEGHFDLAYTVRASTFRGNRDIQVEWTDYRIVEEKGIAFQVPKRHIEVIDFRQNSHPLSTLKKIQQNEDIQVWSEGSSEELGGQDRYSLTNADVLAIWTTPPGNSELQKALETVNPHKVYLFGINPGFDQLDAFLLRIMGLIKYTLTHSQGHAYLTKLAAATAQREIVILTGLEWLEARGYICVIQKGEEEVWVTKGDGMRRDTTTQIINRLKLQLEESAAYREYFSKAQKEMLFSHIKSD